MKHLKNNYGARLRSAYCPQLRKYLRIPDKVLKVASLTPSITSTIIDLGLKDRLVAYSPWCKLLRYFNYEVPELPVVGTYDRLFTEVIKEVSPDLVLISGGAQEVLINSLESLGIPYYVIRLPEGMDFLNIPIEVGYVLNCLGRAHELLRSYGHELSDLVNKVKELGLVGTKVGIILDIHELVIPGFANHITQLLNFVGYEVINEFIEGSYVWGSKVKKLISEFIEGADVVLIQAPKAVLSSDVIRKYLRIVNGRKSLILPILTLTDYSLRIIKNVKALSKLISEVLNRGGTYLVSTDELLKYY